MFIHKEAAVLAEAIKHIMNNLPKGAISEPRDVAVLQQWFYFMSDASMLKRIIFKESKRLLTGWNLLPDHLIKAHKQNRTRYRTQVLKLF